MTKKQTIMALKNIGTKEGYSKLQDTINFLIRFYEESAITEEKLEEMYLEYKEDIKTPREEFTMYYENVRDILKGSGPRRFPELDHNLLD